MLLTVVFKVSVKVTLFSPCLLAFFHPYSLPQWHTQSNENFQNLSIKISRLIIIVVQVLGKIIYSRSGGAQEKGKTG
jgi:hypothetical protein